MKPIRFVAAKSQSAPAQCQRVLDCFAGSLMVCGAFMVLDIVDYTRDGVGYEDVVTRCRMGHLKDVIPVWPEVRS